MKYLMYLNVHACTLVHVVPHELVYSLRVCVDSRVASRTRSFSPLTSAQSHVLWVLAAPPSLVHSFLTSLSVNVCTFFYNPSCTCTQTCLTHSLPLIAHMCVTYKCVRVILSLSRHIRDVYQHPSSLAPAHVRVYAYFAMPPPSILSSSPNTLLIPRWRV